MGVRITSDEDKAALFDSVTGWAFGPVFDNSDEADDFLVYCESAELALCDVTNPTRIDRLAAWPAKKCASAKRWGR